MKILAIILALLIGLFGFRLIMTGLKALIMFLKVDAVPIQAKQTIFRDILLGVLLIILAIFIIT